MNEANPFQLDPDTLTLGEYAVIEDMTGLGFTEIIEGFATRAVTSPKFLLALQVVAGSRSSDLYSFDDAADTLLTDLDLGGDDG